MNKRFLETWGYIVELVICSLVMVVVIIIWGSDFVASFIATSSSDISSYFSVAMFAGATAFYWAFYSKSDTPFANWLYEKGAYKVYSRAYLWAIGVYAVLSLMLFIAKSLNDFYVSLVTFWLLLLGVINLYTFFKNISSQLRLNMEFNKLRCKKP